MATLDKLTMLHMAVKNMDELKEFYTDKLGFKVNNDYAYDEAHASQAGVPAGSRWISMELPGGGTSINLTNLVENMKPGGMKLYLSTPDIEKACSELESKGVELAHEITHAGWASSFDFLDPEGNQWVVIQSK